MARLGRQRNYEGITPEVIYETCKTVLKDLGFEVYKLRPIAFLAEGRINSEQGLVLANLITSAFTKELSLVVKSETASQEMVDQLGNQILEALDKKLLK